jgi:hypothetical protein
LGVVLILGKLQAKPSIPGILVRRLTSNAGFCKEQLDGRFGNCRFGTKIKEALRL